LVRIEGNAYNLPLGSEERVEINPIMEDVEIFDVYHQEDKILVLLQQQEKEPISFMVQGISKPEKKKSTVLPKDTNGTKSSAAPSPSSLR